MMLRRLIRDETGATAIEYALVAVMISIACIAGMQAIGSQSNVGWQGVWTKTKAAVGD